MDFNFDIDPGFFDTQYDYASSDNMMIIVNEDDSSRQEVAHEESVSSRKFCVSNTNTTTQVEDDESSTVSSFSSHRRQHQQQQQHGMEPQQEHNSRHHSGVKEIPTIDTILTNNFKIPHRGSLSRVKLDNGNVVIYTLDVIANIQAGGNFEKYTLQFSSEHYVFLLNVFAVLDSESRGYIHRKDLEDFVLLRCPVFARRDRDLASCASKKIKSQLDTDTEKGSYHGCTLGSLTFDQVWKSVVSCALNCSKDDCDKETSNYLGMEGWMLFARFISLAQYYDAKRRFSARHLQTSGGGGTHDNQREEVVIVEVPPLVEPPMELRVENLIQFDLFLKQNNGGDDDQFTDSCEILLPELDLDHYYIAVHDSFRKFQSRSMPKDVNQSKQLRYKDVCRSMVKVSVFAPTHQQHSPPKSIMGGSSENYVATGDNLEFIITYLPHGYETKQCDLTTVRRSYKDLLWLHDTFKSHKQLGGQLCGRILPPFPSSFHHSQRDVSSVNGAAVAVASAGVGIVNTAAKTAKSLWGSLPGTKKITKMVKMVGVVGNHGNENPTVKVASSPPKTFSSKSHEIYEKELYETPQSKARQLEKYLNYMLEHPALSSSFPLRIILKASQSGLDAAKHILNNQTIMKRNATSIADLSVNYNDGVLGLRSSLLQCLPSPSNASNLEWVRTAAQAALILKVHGILETAGYQSTSTKLQHASLPRFTSKDVHPEIDSSFVLDNVDEQSDNFDDKDAISELGNESHDDCEGFDLLPDPLPLPERSALCAGSIYTGHPAGNGFDVKSYSSQANSTQGKNFYASSGDTNLGDIDVERDIERLRELLRRVSRSFGSCCNSLATIKENLRTRELLHVSILRNIDSWDGLRGKIVSQKALLDGVSSLEESRKVGCGGFSSFFEDMIWLASLASSAYNSSKDVCRSILAAKTASRAKYTAHLAVKNAIAEEETLDKGAEASASYEKVQKCKLQELHAAVIDHEANSAKRHSVVSLANDVKYWNVRRKHELLSACIKVAKEQRSAVEKSLIAWNHLKDGILDSPDAFVTIKCIDSSHVNSSEGKLECNRNDNEQTLGQKIKGQMTERLDTMDSSETNECSYSFYCNYVIDDASRNDQGHGNYVLSHLDNGNRVSLDEGEDKSIFDDALSSSAKLSDVDSVGRSTTEACAMDNDDDNHRFGETESKGDGDNMTDSMQSLVDGLLTWGGGNWETEDDFELPVSVGMAKCLAAEQIDELALT